MAAEPSTAHVSIPTSSLKIGDLLDAKDKVATHANIEMGGYNFLLPFCSLPPPLDMQFPF
jgi:hypothetical protein